VCASDRRKLQEIVGKTGNLQNRLKKELLEKHAFSCGYTAILGRPTKDYMYFQINQGVICSI
jgi:hypothetical protein